MSICAIASSGRFLNALAVAVSGSMSYCDDVGLRRRADLEGRVRREVRTEHQVDQRVLRAR